MPFAAFTILAVVLRIFANPVANVFQKQLTAKGHHPLVVNFLTYFGLSICCIPMAAQVNWQLLPASFWLFSLLGGLVGAMGNGFLVRALQQGDLSVLGPINAYKSVVGLLVGFFLLGEVPNVWGLLGTALIIWGSYVVLDTTNDRFSWTLLRRRDIQYRIWALVLTATEAVFIKKIIQASDVNTAFFSWCWFGALFALFLLPAYKQQPFAILKQLTRADFLYYFFLIVCIGTMQVTTNYVLSRLPVGYALALFQLSILISVLLGYRFFQESHIRKKLVGAAIMIAGSAVIILLK